MVIIKKWLLCVLGINTKKQILDYTELSDLIINTMNEHSILYITMPSALQTEISEFSPNRYV